MKKLNREDPLRVLIIDHSDVFREIILKFINRYPELKIIGEIDGPKNSLEKILKFKPELILLDIEMPGLFGLDFLPILKEVVPACKIVILTLLDNQSYRKISMDNGADEFVPKHLLVSELIPAINKVLQITLTESTKDKMG